MILKNFNLKVIIFSSALVLALFSNVHALDVFKLDKYFNDNASIITKEQALELNSILAEFDDKTSTQIVALTIPSLEGEDLADYSYRTATFNKIGQKNKDNGVLLLISYNDRKIRIEVAYGLEAYLTDAKTSYIIRNIISPEFKKNSYYLGLKNGLNEIIKTSSDAGYLNDKIKKENKNNYKLLEFFASYIIPLIFFIIILSLSKKNKNHDGFPDLLLGMMLGSMNNNSWNSRNNNDFWKGGGGSGGFGGFGGGGGSFGGGGSSGGW